MHSQLKAFEGIKSELQTNPMPFYSDSQWDVTLMLLSVCAMDWVLNKISRVSKNSGPMLIRLWYKVHKMGPPVLSNSLPDCLCHVLFRRYSPLSLKVVENRTNVKVFGPTCSGETTPTFLWQIVSATYRPPFGKVWLSSVCWSPSAKPGNEVECRFYQGWGKTHFQFEAVCGPKFMSFRDDVADPS